MGFETGYEPAITPSSAEKYFGSSYLNVNRQSRTNLTECLDETPLLDEHPSEVEGPFHTQREDTLDLPEWPVVPPPPGSDLTPRGVKTGPPIKDGNATTMSGIFNVCNSILGAGVLAIPFAFSKTGVVLSPIVLIAVLGMAVYSCQALTYAVHRTNALSYEHLAKLTYGSRLVIWTQFAMILCQFGVCIAYCVVIGDLLPPVLKAVFRISGESLWSDRNFLTGMIVAVVVLPLSLPKSLHALRWTSFAAVIFIVFVAMALLVRSSQAMSNGTEQYEQLGVADGGAAFQTIPIMAFTFSCHPQLFGVVLELKDRSTHNMNVVSNTSLSLCALFYTVIGYFSSIQWGGDTEENILQNFKHDDLMTVGKFCLTVTTVFSIPLLLNVLRATAHNLLFRKTRYETSKVVHVIETSFFLGAAFLISVVLPNIAKVLSITGASTAIFICWILPGLFFWKVGKGLPYRGVRLRALVFVCVSVAVGVCCLVSICVDLGSG